VRTPRAQRIRPVFDPPSPLTAQERRAMMRKRKRSARERSDNDFLAIAQRTPGHPFLAGCEAAGISPTVAEVGKWRHGKGRALAAAWKRWPRSKTLPRLLSVEEAGR
jgi:hypothetical protein